MKVKTHWETIDKKKCFTFFTEDVATNTLLHSPTFLMCRQNKKDYQKLKNDFVSYVLDKEKLELSLLSAEVHKLKENKVKLDLDKIGNESLRDAFIRETQEALGFNDKIK